MLTELIFYSLIGGLFSLIGGLILVYQKKLSQKILLPLLSFAAGAFLSAALLDILPEAIEMVEEPHDIFIFAIIGFVLFFILERFVMTCLYSKHREDTTHSHSDHTESLPLLLILGDSFHNFLDGIVIALAFIADPALGLISAIAIAAHEIPQEIGDFSILLNQGWDRSKIIMVNIGQSLLTIPGVMLGYYAGSFFEPQLPYLLATAAGIFIYIGASDLIPEIHHASGHKHFLKVIIPLVLGIFLVWYLVGLAHS